MSRRLRIPTANDIRVSKYCKFPILIIFPWINKKTAVYKIFGTEREPHCYLVGKYVVTFKNRR